MQYRPKDGPAPVPEIIPFDAAGGRPPDDRPTPPAPAGRSRKASRLPPPAAYGVWLALYWPGEDEPAAATKADDCGNLERAEVLALGHAVRNRSSLVTDVIVVDRTGAVRFRAAA